MPGEERAQERKALREGAITLGMSAYPEATQPSGMQMIGTSADPGVAGALERVTTILATQLSGMPIIVPTKLAEPQTIRDSEPKHPYLVLVGT
jgi:hypothetical protein